eukprot:6998912-Heterocapsa_arctica.AAC.1
MTKWGKESSKDEEQHSLRDSLGIVMIGLCDHTATVEMIRRSLWLHVGMGCMSTAESILTDLR